MQTRSKFMKIIIAGVFLLSLYFLYPTVRMALLSEEGRQELMENDPVEYNYLLKHEINLGLDLQGGMHVLLEVDVAKLLENLAKNKDKVFYEVLNSVIESANNEDIDVIDAVDERLAARNINIARYYISTERKTRDQVLSFLKDQSEEAIKRAQEIISNRVNQLGLQEPIVQVQGKTRIITELAGVKDPSRVRQLLDKTALLEFKLVMDTKVAEAVALKLNEIIKMEREKKAASKVESGDNTSNKPENNKIDNTETTISQEDTSSTVSELFAEEDSTQAQEDKSREELLAENIFFSTEGGILIVPEINKQRALDFFNRPDIREIIFREAGEAEFLLESKPIGELGQKVYRAYLVKKNPELTGETIEDAKGEPNRSWDAASAGQYEVSLRLNDDGTRIFSRVTAANVGRRLAIVLDNQVFSAPTLQVHIRDGRARITGMNSMEDANDLAIVLKAGALPAPVKIIEERTVGPSLGADSVNQGTLSALFGMFLVILFMALYYTLPGLVADIALIFNIVIVIAFMAYLNATLTLPGIAGIILTIGMAVDANVLIYERIREETARGKSILAAIDSGYSKAFSAILDANVTTFLAGVVLFQYGSGPVKGFAVTLMLGIAASMFTAVVVSKNILMGIVTYFNIAKFKMFSIISGTNVSFISARKKAYILSGTVIIAGMIAMVVEGGPQLSIDFKGGTIVQLEFEKPVEINQIRSALSKSEFATSEIKHFGKEGRDVLLRLPATTKGGEVVAKEIEDYISSNITDNSFIEQRVETVGPKVGTELIGNALLAILIAMGGILIYVMWRFEFKFALGALIALAHDVLVTLGIFTILNIEISVTVIAAILTIIGYSLNDTIVVFDRIRENLLLVKDKTRYIPVMDQSINETLSRTIITSLTTFVVVLILAIFGGEVIFDFAFAMILGVIVGTYSSIFVASPAVAEIWMHSAKKK